MATGTTTDTTVTAGYNNDGEDTVTADTTLDTTTGTTVTGEVTVAIEIR